MSSRKIESCDRDYNVGLSDFNISDLDDYLGPPPSGLVYRIKTGLHCAAELIKIILYKFLHVTGLKKDYYSNVFDKPAMCRPVELDNGFKNFNLTEWNDKKKKIKAMLNEMPFLLRRSFIDMMAKHIYTGENSIIFFWNNNQEAIQNNPSWGTDAYAYITRIFDYTKELYTYRSRVYEHDSFAENQLDKDLKKFMSKILCRPENK